ncbi:hypothetical protein MMC12_000251 [Toensbergia leucococca]|nr:hypothetical protein [Toensbergia leucococca]
MLVPAFVVLGLVSSSIGVPDRVEKRQDYSELITLASIAGITLPTDPAVLLSLGPFANNLASALPTSSVLSVLETAAPKSFISGVLYDPSYASSFESAFAAGSSPSWFNALPTDVKSYLHTYSNYGAIATAAAAIESATNNATVGATGSANMTESSTSQNTAATSSSSSIAASPMTTTGSSTTSASSSSGSSTSGSSSASPATDSNSGASHHTGAIVAGLTSLVGVLALIAAL